jgi:hypothetical protein
MVGLAAGLAAEFETLPPRNRPRRRLRNAIVMASLPILVIVGLVAGWSAGLETGPGLVFVYFVLVAVLGARDA